MKKEQYKHGGMTINLDWLPANQAWMVWREDYGYQALNRIYTEAWEAREDFDARVAFFKQVLNGE